MRRVAFGGGSAGSWTGACSAGGAKERLPFSVIWNISIIYLAHTVNTALFAVVHNHYCLYV